MTKIELIDYSLSKKSICFACDISTFDKNFCLFFLKENFINTEIKVDEINNKSMKNNI